MNSFYVTFELFILVIGVIIYFRCKLTHESNIGRMEEQTLEIYLNVASDNLEYKQSVVETKECEKCEKNAECGIDEFSESKLR